MNWLLKVFLALLALATLGVAPVLANDYNWRGYWRTTSGESGYSFEPCGDGTRMCAVLVWLSPDGQKTPLRTSMNKYAVYEAKRVGANTWRGPLLFMGQRANTTLTFKTPTKMTIAGCYLVWCKSFDLVKVARPQQAAFRPGG